MTPNHLDYFEASFADTPGRGVRFLVGPHLLEPLLSSAMIERVARIARLPYLHGPVVLYPDASPKAFGFPAGIVVRTEPGWLYPLASPDMGCGYLVVDTGIEIYSENLDTQAFDEAFEEVVAAIDIGSPAREAASVSAFDAMRFGIAGVDAPAHFSTANRPAEESNSWDPDFSALDRGFIEAALQRALGSAAGHFVACYVVEQTFAADAPPIGRIIACVHVGAAPIRDHLNSTAFYARMAEAAIDEGITSVEDAADGLFALDMNSAIGRSFVGAAMAGRNFGYVNRQVVADRVVEILRRNFAKHVVVDADQLRHVDHVAFELVDGLVRSRRGLQPFHDERPVFITGGEHTHAYLCSTGGNSAITDGLCCHGSPVRDSAGISPHVWEELAFGLDPNLVRRWSQEMSSNTDFHAGRFWSDVANLESVMTYLRTSDFARPMARLRQFMNYRETGL